MVLRFLRVPLLASLAFATLSPAVPVAAQTAPRPVQTADDPWLYKNSDLVHDDEWKFGRLSNGLRYAVRRNGVPAGQVSVRVRMDAGSLMEADSERGYAHLIEHLAFRGSAHVPDGESKRIWQRLGVTFGSDSNASTSFTQTVYKLDLPMANRQSLDESFRILSGMMAAPAITAQALNAERPVVLAEQREQPAPQARVQDALLDLMFAGQPLAKRDPIGTVETLNAASPESVAAFHDRWYRPERTVVIAIGDVDPALLEEMIRTHFAAWTGKGPAPASPDFGKPTPGHAVAAAVVEPTIPPMAMMAVVRPWTVFADTVIFNQKRMIDLVAVRIMNRRLESRARRGASFVGASADLSDIARSANVTTVQVFPLSDDWEAALRDVRSVIAELQTNPPSQAEIDRELAEIDAAMRQRISTAPVEAGSKIADNLVEAVDINETVTTPEGSHDIFKGAVAAKMFTPESVQASARKVFEGVETRALVNVHAPDASVVAKVTTALKADVRAAQRTKRARAVTFADLPRLGAAGKVVSREKLVAEDAMEKVVFANGVNLLLRPDPSETGKVYVRVRFGGGLNAVPSDRPSPVWAGSALSATGIGKLGQEELDALMGPRQIGLSFSVGEDAFLLAGQTNKDDLADQLKLLAAKLAVPAWDASPIVRARVALLAGYAGLSASPDAVLARDLEGLLHDGDPRWATPPRAAIEALTPDAFRAFWEPLLKTGPIEVEVFGDVEAEPAVQAVAASFGALKPRAASSAAPAPVRFPAHVAGPVTRTHSGSKEQAAAVIAWPTGGGSAGIGEGRRIEVLAAIFRDRLLEQLRSQAGVSYSPQVGSDWPAGLSAGGRIVAIGMVPPDKIDFFFQLARGIAADLAAKPIEQDELDRALMPLKQQILRAASGNMFWMRQIEGGSFDPARVAAMQTIGRDYASVTPAEVQALAAKYLRPEADWTMKVVPE